MLIISHFLGLRCTLCNREGTSLKIGEMSALKTLWTFYKSSPDWSSGECNIRSGFMAHLPSPWGSVWLCLCGLSLGQSPPHCHTQSGTAQLQHSQSPAPLLQGKFPHVTFSSAALVSIKVTHLSFNSTGSCSVYSPSTEGTSVHLKVFLPFAHRQEEYWPSEEGVRVKSDEGAGVAVTYQRGFMFNTHSKPQRGICLQHTLAFNQL